MDKSGSLRILIIISIVQAYLVVAAATAPTQPLPRTDAVYLLDVTSSMVGYDGGIKPCDKSKDILNQVLDLLLVEIERFSHGRIILITFADGPYDLDEPGPIQDTYSIEINSNADKHILRQFIRPTGASAWPGIYETVYRRTCVERRNIGNTAIYDTILTALRKLQELQAQYPEGADAYTASHTQEIIVFTDGEDNASKNSFDRVLTALQVRHFEMAGRFHYKRYLFSNQPRSLKQAQDECTIVEREEAGSYVQNVVAPNIAQLVIVDFDRSLLEFSENLWTPTAPGDAHTVTLRNIQVYYDHAQENLLSGARLVLQPVQPEDFGLPGNVAIRVRTEPDSLIFPLAKFDLSLSFEPLSLLEQHLNHVKRDKLTGTLHFGVIPPGARETQRRACYGEAKGILIDVRRASLPVEIGFRRPELTVAVKRSAGNQLRIDLVPNSVLAGLSRNQRSVVIQFLPAVYLADLRDEQGTAVPQGQPLVLRPGPLTLFATFHGPVPCSASIEAEMRLAFLEPLASSMINGEIRSIGSFPYRIRGVNLQPSQLVTENLWTPQRWRSSTNEAVIIPFTLEVCSPGSGTLRLSAKNPELPAYVRVQPESLEIKGGGGAYQLQVIVQPHQDWEALAEPLKKPGPHVFLEVDHEVSEEEGLVAPPPPIPVTLRYLPQYVIARIESLLAAHEKVTPGSAVYKLDIQSVGIPSAQELLTLESPPSIWRVQRIGTAQVSPVTGPFSLGPGEYELRLEPTLPRSVQQGTLHFKTLGPWPLLVLLGSQEIRLPEGQYDLPYLISVGDVFVLVRCDGLSRGPRWRRGQALLRCMPHFEDTIPSPGDQLEFIPQCGSGLLVRLGSLELSCGTPIPLGTFEIFIAPNAPAGIQIAQQLDDLRIEARYGTYQQLIVVDLQKPRLRGYLLPLLYDQLGERVLLGLVGLTWGLGGLTLLGLVLYAALIQKENPLIFLINYVWYEERWRRLATIWLVVGVVFVVVQLLVSWGLRLSYGI